MRDLLRKIKQLFSRKKSPESLEMWDKLSDDYTGDPEFHPSLDLNASYAMSLTQKDRDAYLTDLMRRRQRAHNETF